VKAKMKNAKRSRDYLQVLEYGEEILTKNPWDSGTQLDMAEAADTLGLVDVAVWILEQARQKDPKDPSVNRALAKLLEKRGNFSQAIGLWELVRKALPNDLEAQHKGKDLAATQTIAKNQSRRMGMAEPGAAAQPAAASAEPKQPPTTAQPGTAAGPAPAAVAAAPATPLNLPPSAKPTADRVAHEAATLRAKIDNDPTNANAYLHLASVYRRAGQSDQAREVLEQGLGPTGKNFDLTLELAELDLEPFRKNLAITEEKLKTNPQDEELRTLRIRLLKEINTREMDLFRQKAERYPTEKSNRFELGVRLLRAQQVDEAIRELQGVRADPRYQWKALLYLGFCFKTRNNWRLAQRNFEEALPLLPPTEDGWRKEILFQLAQGSAESGDLPKAIDLGHELANMDFTFHDIGKLLDEWQDRLDANNAPPPAPTPGQARRPGQPRPRT
jgi:tetratricopeptide (TPR) repeat protein